MMDWLVSPQTIMTAASACRASHRYWYFLRGPLVRSVGVTHCRVLPQAIKLLDQVSLVSAIASDVWYQTLDTLGELLLFGHGREDIENHRM